MNLTDVKSNRLSKVSSIPTQLAFGILLLVIYWGPVEYALYSLQNYLREEKDSRIETEQRLNASEEKSLKEEIRKMANFDYAKDFFLKGESADEKHRRENTRYYFCAHAMDYDERSESSRESSKKTFIKYLKQDISHKVENEYLVDQLGNVLLSYISQAEKICK